MCLPACLPPLLHCPSCVQYNHSLGGAPALPLFYPFPAPLSGVSARLACISVWACTPVPRCASVPASASLFDCRFCSRHPFLSCNCFIASFHSRPVIKAGVPPSLLPACLPVVGPLQDHCGALPLQPLQPGLFWGLHWSFATVNRSFMTHCASGSINELRPCGASAAYWGRRTGARGAQSLSCCC